ncbi:MAG TPA: CO dehydrogenase/acetyl-CoA synthase complex subunit epsilon, partial [Methanomicrobiales archaeon]|nr:CO dehydrogenase/acetyl-CoA synthase complex subunit epsilon [Methanomicrobiales archaeon]
MAEIGSWQTAEVGGPKKAAVVKKPEVVVAMLRRADRPLLVVGHLAGEIACGERSMIDCLIDLARITGCTLIATGNASAALRERGTVPDAVMPAVDVGNRLTDPAWRGIDGKGSYDLVLLAGLPYPMGYTILSGLKHFSPKVKTICLDPGYQPQANWSF